MANTPQQGNSPKNTPDNVDNLANSKGPGLKQNAAVVLSIPELENYSGDLQEWYKAVRELFTQTSNQLSDNLNSLLPESAQGWVPFFTGELVGNLIYHDALQLHGQLRKDAELYLTGKECIGLSDKEWETLITQKIAAAQGKEMKVTASTESGSLVLEVLLINKFEDFKDRWEARDSNINVEETHGRGLQMMGLFCKDAEYVSPDKGGPLLRFTRELEEPSSE